MCDLPLQHYTQVNISEWCKGWKSRGHLHSPDFNIKWVLFPSFNPSLPISLLLFLPLISPISVSVPPSASLIFSFCPRTYSVTPRRSPRPRKKELNILHNNSSTVSQRSLSKKKNSDWLWVDSISTTTSHSAHYRMLKINQQLSSYIRV